MSSIVQLESSRYSIEKVRTLKDRRKIAVVFSTFGEREADLIFQKITLLKSELGNIIDRFVLSHRRQGSKEERTEIQALKADSSTLIIPCNDVVVPDMGTEKGKGADMRRTLYVLNRDGGPGERETVIVFLDADVLPKFFGSHFVLGLAGAVLEGHDFSKAGFWREMGRVKKYVAQPLFSVINHPALDKLADLSYPLSGEVAGTMEFFNNVCFWQMYGVETGINIDAVMGEYRIADVNLGLYDHEHQGETGIQKMSFGIIRTFLTQMMEYGLIEFKNGASVSNIFKATFVNGDGERQVMEFDLTEKKYRPLKEIL